MGTTAASNRFLVVMAGGSGTRFWPKSTSRKPKQLLKFGGARTLLGETLSRFDGIVPENQRIIVTTKSLEGAVRDEVPSDTIVLAEPQGRNTAPCIFWAAKWIESKNPNATMLVMPSDHFIPNLEAFRNAVVAATEHAEASSSQGDLITLGVEPDRAETGYGYLHVPDLQPGKLASTRVAAFVEKPNQQKADEFFAGKKHLWNAGMFIWSVPTILNAFDKHMPEYIEVWNSCSGNIEDSYPKLTATSIDFGIMEKATPVVTYPLNCGWNDLGNWTSLDTLADEIDRKQDGNVLMAGNLINVESKGNIVDAPDRLVSLLGVDDLIIVDTGKALLVGKKTKAQEIRSIVEKVKANYPDLA